MFQAGNPICFRMNSLEVVAIVGKAIQCTARQYRLCIDCIGAGLIQGDGIQRGKHAYIGNDRCIVFVVAIAMGRDVDDEVDMEAGLILDNRLCVFGNFVVDHIISVIFSGRNSVEGANADAAAAAGADFMMNGSLTVFQCDGIVCTIAFAGTTAYAKGVIYARLAVGMHFHFASTGTGAHADIFQSTTHARQFMHFKMSEGDDDIGIGNRAADLGFLDVFAVFYGDQCFIRSL